MSSQPSIYAVVMLAGVDAYAVQALQPAAEVLESFGIRTTPMVGATDAPPDGCAAVIVASADADLPAVFAQRTGLPVIRVPTASDGKTGLALLDDGAGNLPGGPTDGAFATMAIGQAGAKNAALFVVSLLASHDERLRAAWEEFRARQTEAVLRHPSLNLND